MHLLLPSLALLAVGALWPASDWERLAQDRANLERQIQELPARLPFEPAPSVGFHSRWVSTADSSLDVTLDLGEVKALDTLYIVPAFPSSGWGYGFPSRFRVEVSSDKDFRSKVILLDRSHEDHPVPNGPIRIAAGGGGARWIRFVATKLSRQPNWEQGYLFCLGEIMAFSGGRNVALGCRVEGSNSQKANQPTWSPENLVDGFTSLGLPVLPDSQSAAEMNSGWHSLESVVPDTVKWVQVDLGREVSVQEIRAIPAHPVTFTNRPGFGFPVRFQIQLSRTPDFESPLVAVDQSQGDYPNPGDNEVIWPIPSLKARYVRFHATRLFMRWNDFVFALSELEVYSDGVNVARGAAVSCPEASPNRAFKPEYLVDGRSSSGRVLNLQSYLDSLALRADLEQRVESARGLEEEAQIAQQKRWLLLGWIAGGGLCCAGGALIWRVRRQRTREIQSLREQIARDLHDEIGSSLGSIALLSELGKQEGDLEALGEIHQLAADAADSMRGILWMIRDGKALTLRELEAVFRTQVERSLHGVKSRFETQNSAPEEEMPLSFHRHLFLFFKEALHNAARHSGASLVVVRMRWEPGLLCLEVSDNGCGFDVSERFSGSGLANMRHRAGALAARLNVESEIGKGTRVGLEVKL